MSVHKTTTPQFLDSISPIEDIIQDAKAGKIYILVDDENRENEGDVIISAQCITPEAINFFITHAKGLVCLTLEHEQTEKLGLSLQKRSNSEKYGTAFTTSIEARTGVTTGISAHDRSHTISVAIHKDSTAEHIATPGHIFPLIGDKGGVAARNGHTEASIEISKLAGHTPSAVICEIINADGSMARLPDIIQFAKRFDLKIGTIADLVQYVKNNKG